MGTDFTVLLGGNKLNITNIDGSITQYYYVDDDSTTDTFFNNKIMVKRGNAAPQMVFNFVNRNISEVPFIWPGGKAPLTLRIRLGEPVGTSKFGFTGLGVQAVDILTTVARRNK